MSGTRIVVARSVTEAGAAAGAWRALQRRALDANVFLTPDFLIPLMRHRGEKDPAQLVFVYSGDDIIGAAAFGTPRPLHKLGPGVLPTWRQPYFLDATPLLDRDRADEAATALVDWLDRSAQPWSLVRWERLSLESATWRALDAVARGRGRRWWTRHSFRRPVVNPDGSFDDFLARLTGKRRGKLRWRMNRLEKDGRVEVVLHQDLTDGSLLDRFLQLEAMGWKGEAGTALSCSAADEAFFREASNWLAAAGGLFFLELKVDGEPAAITANYRDGDTVFLFKSGFDPEPRLAKASPGIVNLLHLTRIAHEMPGVARLDSCANEGSHLEQIWDEGIAFGEILMATRAYSGLAVATLPLVRESRDRLGRVLARLAPGAA